MIGRRGNRYFVRVHRSGKNVWVGTFDRSREGYRRAKRAEQEALDRVGTLTHLLGDELANLWLRDYPRPRDSTNQACRYALKPFREHFGHRRVASITRREARKWALEYRSRLWATSAMFSDAVRDDLLPSNPFVGLKIPQSRGRKDLIPITIPELHRIADLAPEVHGFYGHTFRAMILFAGYVGIRPGELFALEWEHIQPTRVRIEWERSRQGKRTRPKNGKPRTVVLPKPAREALNDAYRVPGQSHVFLTKGGRQMTHGIHWTLWDAVRKEANHPGMAWYELRHVCATYLLEIGLSQADVAIQLGHTDGGRLVAERYGHPDHELARQRIDLALEEAAEMDALAQTTKEAARHG